MTIYYGLYALKEMQPFNPNLDDSAIKITLSDWLDLVTAVEQMCQPIKLYGNVNVKIKILAINYLPDGSAVEFFGHFGELLDQQFLVRFDYVIGQGTFHHLGS